MPPKTSKNVKQILKNKKKIEHEPASRFRYLAVLPIIMLLCVAYFVSSQEAEAESQASQAEPKLASSSDQYPAPEAIATEILPENQRFELTCPPAYLTNPEHQNIPHRECIPQNQNCGRFYVNALDHNIVTHDEINTLVAMAKLGTMIVGGGAGGASIIEMHTSTASYKENFVSLFNRMDQGDQKTIEKMKILYSSENLAIYHSVKNKVANLIGQHFNVNPEHLHLAAPTFFSQLTNLDAKSMNDEYWHTHIDTNQYQAFHYTSLVYLSTFGEDFEGGRFIFEGQDLTNGLDQGFGSSKSHVISPKLGTISIFSSEKENIHRVERVTSGTRLAFTMGFTCNSKYAISDPQLPEKWRDSQGKDEL